MQVKYVREFLEGFAVSSAMMYGSAFNMVGWKFALPGNYSYGAICILLFIVNYYLFARTSESQKPAPLTIGFIVSATLPVIFFYGSIVTSKDYFVFGLPVAILLTFCCVLSVILRTKEAKKAKPISVRRVAFTFARHFSILLVAYGVALLISDGEYGRFLRQQMYVLPFGAAIAILMLRMEFRFWGGASSKNRGGTPERGQPSEDI